MHFFKNYIETMKQDHFVIDPRIKDRKC